MDERAHELNAYWYAADSAPSERAGSRQYGDGAVNFNAKRLYNSSRDIAHSEFAQSDSALFKKGDGWLRGRSICVRESQKQSEWVSLGSKTVLSAGSVHNDYDTDVEVPDYLIGTEQGWSCGVVRCPRPLSFTNRSTAVSSAGVQGYTEKCVCCHQASNCTGDLQTLQTYQDLCHWNHAN